MTLTVKKDGRVNPVLDIPISKRDFDGIVGLLERRRRRRLAKQGKGQIYRWDMKSKKYEPTE